MACEVLKMPGGGRAFLCSRGRRVVPRCFCGTASSRTCAAEACGAPLCDRHALRAGARDLCPRHGAPAPVVIPPRNGPQGRSAAAPRLTLDLQLDLF